MWTAIGLTLGFICLLVAVIWNAKNSGKNAAKLEMIKSELNRIAREQERANKIMDNVRNMSYDDVRNRLQNINRK